MIRKRNALLLLALALVSCGGRTEVLIVGGGTSGTAAAFQAAKMGASTMLVEESTWLGGMLTAAGVSAVDGNYALRSGLYAAFVDSLARHYGGVGALQTGWVSRVLFEPHVGDRIFKHMLAAAGDPEIRYRTTFLRADRLRHGWKVRLAGPEGEYTVRTRMLIDGTELGDVAKACGVPYRIGMDARADTGEDIAPEQANGIVQDLTYCMTLKDYGPDADRTIARPAGYDSTLYLNSAAGPFNRDFTEERGVRFKADTRQRIPPPEMMLSYGRLPVTSGGTKYMINWPTDGNDVYVNIVDADAARRRAALDSCKHLSLGFLYFIQTQLGYRSLDLADDEYPTEDRLPFLPYHRESRRIEGRIQFTVDAAARPYEYKDPLYRTGIGSGNYPVDHHHYRNPVWMTLPELHFYPIPSYSLPLGVMLPKTAGDLIVAEKSVSVSNLVNGTTRLQPVVLQIGQAAGALAVLALKAGGPERVKVRDLQDVLLSEGVYIQPYQDLTPDDARFCAEQRIGATGILRGRGTPKGWANETWFRTEAPLAAQDLHFEDYYPEVKPAADREDGTISVAGAFELLARAAEAAGRTLPAGEAAAQWETLGLGAFDPSRAVTRIEFAVLLDALLDPFHAVGVDLTGRLLD